MDNRNIATFVKVVEFNNFTKAAESLGYSQAGVTAQIKSLERELGVPLFDRLGKRICLTQEGRAFLPHALDLLKAEEEALASVRADSELKGELRICTGSSHAMGALPHILLEFIRLHPAVNIVVKISDFIEDTTLRLSRGETDFLVYIDEAVTRHDHHVVASKPEPVIFVTHPGSSLCTKKEVCIKEILLQEPFIISDRDVSYCLLLERELLRRGLEVRPVMEIGSVGGIINTMLEGYGVSYIPEFMAEKELKQGQLVKLNVIDFDIPMYTHYVCSHERWINPVMREFIRIVNQE